MEQGSGLFRRIWSVTARIPRGRVATYGQIARLAGLPGGARTAGWAMASLPEGHRIAGRPVPWHRVINAAGGISLTGAAGALQAARLRREGITLSPGRRVTLARHQWRPAAATRLRRRPARPAPRRHRRRRS